MTRRLRCKRGLLERGAWRLGLGEPLHYTEIRSRPAAQLCTAGSAAIEWRSLRWGMGPHCAPARPSSDQSSMAFFEILTENVHVSVCR